MAANSKGQDEKVSDMKDQMLRNTAIMNVHAHELSELSLEFTEILQKLKEAYAND